MNNKLWLIFIFFVLLLLSCNAFSGGAEEIVDQDSAISAEAQSSQSVPAAAQAAVEGAAVGGQEQQDAPDEPLDSNESIPTLPAAQESAPDEQSSSLIPADCPFAEPAGYDISCGYLEVPEKRTQANPRSIQLAYVIVHAPVDEGRPPIVYLAGGPGGSAVDDFVSDPEGWNYPFTQTRDLILIDQRGTGYSLPTLDCPELAEEVDFEDENPEVVCHDRLVAEGIDLSAYNTAENAADVAALREALGLESWDLLGISYGTRLALEIMRDYPEGVRSVVLDSVFPPNADTPGEEGLSALWSLQWLFTECANDGYCSENYPDLETVFIDTVAALNENPVDEIYGDDFAFTISNALNDTSLIPLVPLTIYAVANGDMAALDELSTDESGANRPRFQDGADHSDSEGMYNSVICHDEYVFGSYETAEARVIQEAPDELEAFLLQPVADLFQVCSFWGAGEAGSRQNEPVTSSIPTLILAGQYDSATPPEWAALTAQTLLNDFLFEFPGAGHSLLSSDECAVSITADFLNAPEQEPDSSCIDEIEWPYFE